MRYSRNMNRNIGFTAIEILIVLAIATVLFAIIVSGFAGLREHSDMNLVVDTSVSYLQEARTKTLSSENASVYGVHFETSQFVFFVGSTYSAVSTTNKVYTLPSSVEVSPINLEGGGVDVVFKRLTGETDEYGTVTLRKTADPSVTKVIQILSTGLAGVQ